MFGLAKAYSATLGIDGDADRPRQQRPRRLAHRRPGGQRVDRRRHPIEVAAQPADALRRRWIGGRPDVGALEVRAARVWVAGALNDREPAGVEDGAQVRSGAGSGRAHSRRCRTRSGARCRPGSPAFGRRAKYCGVVVGDDRAQRVVAAAQVEDDEVAPRPPLGAGEVGQRNAGAAKPTVNAATPPRTKSRLVIAIGPLILSLNP